MAAATDRAPDDAVRADSIRAFNRFYTGVIGVLGEGLLDSPYSLTEARVLFELAQKESIEAADLRRDLHLDPGYLSRILARFERDGLVVRAPSSEDRRRRVARLTDQGRTAFELLDTRAVASARDLVAGLGDEGQRRLLAAMATIQRLLERTAKPGAYLLRPLRAGDLGWVVHRHGVLYAEEYGWDQRFEALVARVVAEYVDHHDPQREQAWIAEVDGEPVGCVFCVAKDERTAQLRLLLVEPRTRGMSVGTRLVDECVRFAQLARYEKLTLWTNDVLGDARRIYERAGFALVAEEHHDRFGPPVVGQHWERTL